jgi:hypothetical protein
VRLLADVRPGVRRRVLPELAKRAAASGELGALAGVSVTRGLLRVYVPERERYQKRPPAIVIRLAASGPGLEMSTEVRPLARPRFAHKNYDKAIASLTGAGRPRISPPYTVKDRDRYMRSTTIERHGRVQNAVEDAIVQELALIVRTGVLDDDLR